MNKCGRSDFMTEQVAYFDEIASCAVATPYFDEIASCAVATPYFDEIASCAVASDTVSRETA